MPRLSRTKVKPLAKLWNVKQKFKDLPPIKFNLTLPLEVAGALDGADDLEENLIGEIATTLGGSSEDYRTAKRIRKLQLAGIGNGVTSGTLPELVVYDYLKQGNHEFLFQPQVDGGRGRSGGTVPDFAVLEGGSMTVILVNGVYWHERGVTANSDVVDKITIMSSTIGGFPVSKVVEVWDKRLYQNRNRTMEMALSGVELGY